MENGEDPRVTRGVSVDYKKLAGYSRDSGKKMETQSVKSVRSRKSSKSVKSKKVVTGKGRGKGGDSRYGDFDSESAKSSTEERLCDLQNEIEDLAPSAGLRYNERKVAEGFQDRLEDSELPANLEDVLFSETKKLHIQQKDVTEERGRRAKRRLELTRLREEIVAAREQAQKDEWEAEALEKENRLKRNRWLIEKRRQELELKKQEEQQAIEMAQLNCAYHDVCKGQTPREIEHGTITTQHDVQIVNADEQEAAMRALFVQKADRCVTHQQSQTMNTQGSMVEDWLSKHSSGVRETGYEEDLDELQSRACAIMADKMNNRPARQTRKSAIKVNAEMDSDTEESEQSELVMSRGVKHLKKLGLVPGGFGRRTEVKEAQEPQMAQARVAGRRQLSNYMGKETSGREVTPERIPDVGGEDVGTCSCGGVKPKVKSGKFAKDISTSGGMASHCGYEVFEKDQL